MLHVITTPDHFIPLFERKCCIFPLTNNLIKIVLYVIVTIPLCYMLMSPLLYGLAAELLQILINEAWHNDHISLPIENQYTMTYPVIQYIDDTFIIMNADPHQLSHLVHVLKIFSDFTGLEVNYSKSSLH